jgi:molybdenum cofactor guanylyltransferase
VTNGPILGVLLAGGGSRRMGGGDKCLRLLGGETILARIVARAAPQVDRLILNANGDATRFGDGRFGDFRLPVVPDSVPGQVGPLAGVLTGIEWARDNFPGCGWVASFASDAPFMPENLVEKLVDAVSNGDAEMACAASGGRAHPVFGLWPVRLAADLRHALVAEDIRKVDAWTARYHIAQVDYPVVEVDPFFNVNRPDDLAAAESLMDRSAVT